MDVLLRRIGGSARRVLVIAAVLATVMGTVSAGQGITSESGGCRATIISSGVSRADLQRVIRLSSPGDTIRVVGTCVGTFVVRQDLTLKGRATDAAPKPTLDAEGAGTVLRLIGDETDLAVIRLRITGGDAELGGGIRVGSGRLLLRESMVRANVASDSGGGVYTRGTVRVRSSSLNGNRARFGGGLFNDGGSASLSGDAAIANNLALYAGGNVPSGGGVYNDGGALLLKDKAVITSNTGDGSGGGIYNGPDSEALLTESSSVEGNLSRNEGGGISNRGTVMTFDASTIIDNRARYYGGGVFNYATLTMNDTSSISGNAAYVRLEPSQCEGGGVYGFGIVTMNDEATIRRNSTGGFGGGIAQEGGSVVLNDSSSIARNSARAGGGGIDSYDSDLTMNGLSKIAGNDAGYGRGGGISHYLGSLNGVEAGVNVRNNVPDDVYPPLT